MTKNNNTASRITVYRLKQRADLNITIAGYDKVAEGTEGTTGYSYALWFGDHGIYVPDWFSPFRTITTKKPTAKQAGFILLVNTCNATYACTGGLGYHKLLECFQIEPRFGIVVAKKILAVHNLKGLAQKDASGIINNLDRAFRGTYNPQGDIDNLHRILTTVRATFAKDSNEYATIGSSVRAGDSLSVNKARDFADIFVFIKSVDNRWNSNATSLDIPELAHINPKHDKALIDSLNQALAEAILAIKSPNNNMRPDLFLDNINMGYLPDRVVEYTVRHGRKQPTTCFSYDEVFDALADILAASNAAADALHTKLEEVKIKLKFDDDHVNTFKPLLQYICGDIVLNNEAYFISNGLWFKANTDFLAKINTELDELLYLPPGDLFLQDWQNNEDEDAYNMKHSGNNSILLDKRFVRVPQEKGPIEFCDLLLDHDGNVNLIHVKHAWGAELRALFAQGYVSAQLYSESDDFRQKVHASNINMGGNLTATERTALANLASRPKREFMVVFAIFDDEASHHADTTAPTKISKLFGNTITLFAKIDLLGRVQAIRSLGYNVALTRIQPYP